MRSSPWPFFAVLCAAAAAACDLGIGDCKEDEVIACLKDACASGQLLDATCDCVAQGKVFDADACGCKDAKELTFCSGDSSCSDYLLAVKSDAIVSDCPGTCMSDVDCGRGELCDEHHDCVPGCSYDSECERGTICTDRKCQKGCMVTSLDCEIPAHCNDNIHQCETLCSDDFDCRPEARCVSGNCVERATCERDADCEGQPGVGICSRSHCL